MRNLLRTLTVLVSLLASTWAYAQFIPEWHRGDLTKKGTRIAVLDEKLDKEATLLLVEGVGGPEMLADWERHVKERGLGIGLTSGGYTLAVAGFCYGGIYLMAGIVGTMFVAIGGQEAVDKLWADMGPQVTIGTAAMVAGLVTGTTGVILLCRGNRRLKSIVAACDAAGLPPVEVPDAAAGLSPDGDSPAVLLTLGPTPSGVGLALHF